MSLSYLELVVDKCKALTQKVRTFIEESECLEIDSDSRTKPTLEQIKYIVIPFINIIRGEVQNVLHLFASPMRFGKTQTIWRMLVPLYHKILGGRLTFIFVSSVSEVAKSDKWKHKRKVGSFNYFSDEDENNVMLFCSETQIGMKKSWKRFCEIEVEKFKNPEYKDYTLTIVMITGFAKEVLQDKTGCLDKLVKASGDVVPLVLWDECGLNTLPNQKFGPPVHGGGSDKLYGAKSKSPKFIITLYKFKEKYNAIVLAFSATLNSLHHNKIKTMYDQSWFNGNEQKNYVKEHIKFDKKLAGITKKFVKFRFQVEKDTMVKAKDSRYTSSILTGIEKFTESNDVLPHTSSFPVVFHDFIKDTMKLNLWNSENWSKCGFVQQPKDRNILLALGNDTSNSGQNAISYIEYNVGISVVVKVLREWNTSIKDKRLHISENKVCIALEGGNYLLSDNETRANPLSNDDVERKCNDGSILILIAKNKFQTGFDCSNFYKVLLCKELRQPKAESVGAAINLQKSGQSVTRPAGSHSGVLGVFSWKDMKLAVSKAYQESESKGDKQEDNKGYKVMEWFVKNNSFSCAVLIDDENKFHTADSTISFIKDLYPSTKDEFMNYLWDPNWEVDYEFDSNLKKQVISEPVPAELIIHKEHDNCPCPNCKMEKGHKAA